MRQGNCNRISRIVGEFSAVKTEEIFDGRRDLIFAGVTLAGDSLLHLSRRDFRHLYLVATHRRDEGAARFAEAEGGVRIDAGKGLFDRAPFGPVFFGELKHRLVEVTGTIVMGELGLRLQNAGSDEADLLDVDDAARYFENAEAGNLRTRVDAYDAVSGNCRLHLDSLVLTNHSRTRVGAA